MRRPAPAPLSRYPLGRIIYTTNTIESYHRQLRTLTKGKSIFPTDDALLKMLKAQNYCQTLIFPFHHPIPPPWMISTPYTPLLS
jgi:hypothetical protein